MRTLTVIKLYCLAIMFVTTLLAGLSTYFMRWSHIFLTLGIQFAGGVFLSTSLLHFLGDANKTFKKLNGMSYPMALMLAVSGYLISMFWDQAAHSINDKRSRQVQQVRSSSFRSEEVHQLDDSTLTGAYRTSVKSLKSESASDADLEIEAKNVVVATIEMESSHHSFADAILLVLGLCFHSVFEGLSIGIADSSYNAWRNTWTIMLHKVLAAISMSVSLLRILPNRSFLSVASYAFGFALASPVGIVIGIVIDSLASAAAAEWTYAMTMSIASGVFLFVAINHLLNKGYVPSGPSQKQGVDMSFWKAMAVVTGATFIFITMLFDS